MAQTLAASSGRARILIADDEPSIRDFVDDVLRLAGYITARALDGHDALAMSEHVAPFDLLLTDELMPRMKGHELARELHERHPNLKVLYLTAYGEQLVQETGALAKHEALLDKPATPDEILEAISRLLSDPSSSA